MEPRRLKKNKSMKNNKIKNAFYGYINRLYGFSEYKNIKK